MRDDGEDTATIVAMVASLAFAGGIASAEVRGVWGEDATTRGEGLLALGSTTHLETVVVLRTCDTASCNLQDGECWCACRRVRRSDTHEELRWNHPIDAGRV
jgi:hypothetical protein